MGIGKYLHRKKGDSPQQPQRSRATSAGASETTFGTTRYEATALGSMPQTGSYPLKGNQSTAAVTSQRASARNSIDDRGFQTIRPGSEPSQPMRGSAPRTDPPPTSDFHFFNEPQLRNQTQPMTNPRQQKVQAAQRGMEIDTDLAQGMGNVRLNDEYAGSAPGTAYYTPSGTSRLDPRVDGPRRNDPSTQRVNEQPQRYRQSSPTYNTRSAGSDGYDERYDAPYADTSRSPIQARDYQRESGELVEGSRKGDSIPRKQVPSHTQPPSSSVAPRSSNASKSPVHNPAQHGPPVPQHNMPLREQKRQQDPPTASRQNYPDLRDDPITPRGPYMNHYTANRPSSREEHYFSRTEAPAPLSFKARPALDERLRDPSGQEVVARAGSNTYDTEVIEKVAPAVTHETVQKKTHHIREEVVTREIHTHDVFHRIQPVIDVEVLPPRHFLPVEGGGLVEIGADEVPGRGNNWVIAETASKIPSDQPAPTRRRGFTARQFAGKEGDYVEFTGDEGQAVSHTTWVHPPELETGGRDSGQTWPMVFGDDSSTDGRGRTHKHSASKDGKARRKKRNSVNRAPAAPPASGQQSAVA